MNNQPRRTDEVAVYPVESLDEARRRHLEVRARLGFKPPQLVAVIQHVMPPSAPAPKQQSGRIPTIKPDDLTDHQWARSVFARIAMRYQVSVDELTGISRRRAVLRARRIALHLIAGNRERGVPLSLVKVGRITGRDHSTIVCSLGDGAAYKRRKHGISPLFGKVEATRTLEYRAIKLRLHVRSWSQVGTALGRSKSLVLVRSMRVIQEPDHPLCADVLAALGMTAKELSAALDNVSNQIRSHGSQQ